jgi:hypothetical protein
MYLCVAFMADVNTIDVFRKNDFWCLANGRSIEVGIELSGTIASHKALTLIVGMAMSLDDFRQQWMLQKVIILF